MHGAQNITMLKEGALSKRLKFGSFFAHRGGFFKRGIVKIKFGALSWNHLIPQKNEKMRQIDGVELLEISSDLDLSKFFEPFAPSTFLKTFNY